MPNHPVFRLTTVKCWLLKLAVICLFTDIFLYIAGSRRSALPIAVNPDIPVIQDKIQAIGTSSPEFTNHTMIKQFIYGKDYNGEEHKRIRIARKVNNNQYEDEKFDEAHESSPIKQFFSSALSKLLDLGLKGYMYVIIAIQVAAVLVMIFIRLIRWILPKIKRQEQELYQLI